ncbi:MAG TPA: hypothetical protein VFE11_12480 [Dongiaceae bacterium]|jgi:hypothetical protein|nr:hypothetical protein [Dongiaceae bacterium]
MPDRGGAELEGLPASTFKPMMTAAGPTDEHWHQHLIFIRGAKAALRFDDQALTERMRSGFDTDEDALDPIRAWALTERQLVAAIEILRAAQARCKLAISRVGTRAGDAARADKAKGAAARM